MSKDFLSNQIRSNKLIASGTSDGRSDYSLWSETHGSFGGEDGNEYRSGGPSLLIYSASAATNFDGGLNSQLLTNVGHDVFLFISGSKHATASKRNNVALFGGDVVISGSLTDGNGSPIAGGNITVREADGNPSVAGVTTIVVSNGDLTDDGGGTVTIDTSGAVLLNNDANNRVVTADGAGGINGEANLTFDGSTFTCSAAANFNPPAHGKIEIDDANTDGKVSIFGDGKIYLFHYSDTPTSEPMLSFYRSRGNSGGQSAVSLDDEIGTMTFYGRDANSNGVAAKISVHADGASSGTTDTPGRISFFTTPDGTSTEVIRQVIKNDGMFLFNSGGNGASPNESAYPDTIFFVSGSIGSKEGNEKGVAVFGGDAHVSGTLYVGASEEGPEGNYSTLVIDGHDYSGKLPGISIQSEDSTGGGIKFSSPSDTFWALLGGNYNSGSPFLNLGTYAANGFLILRTGNSVEAVRIDQNQDVGIGSSNPTGFRLKIQDDGGNGPYVGIVREDSGGITAEETLGTIWFGGTTNDTTFGYGASISAIADGGYNPSTDNPGRLEFSTTKDGTASVVVRQVIKNDGMFLFNSGGDGSSPNESSYGDTIFFSSGSIQSKNKLNEKGVSLFGGDLVVSGAQFFEEIPSGKIPGTVAHGTIALYAQDVAGITKLYFKNESGETEVGSGKVSAVANGANNRITTFSSADALNGEANLTFDGSTLTCNGEANFTPNGGGKITIDDDNTDGKTEIYGDGKQYFFTYGDFSYSEPKINFYRGRGSDTGITAPQEGDDLGTINWLGFDTAHATSAAITAEADSNHGDSGVDTPGRLIFKTVANSSSTLVERQVIKSDGMVLFNSGGNAGSPNEKEYKDTIFFVSGSVGSKDSSSKGTSTFGGDVVVSGSLYGGLRPESGQTALDLVGQFVGIYGTQEGLYQRTPGLDESVFISGSIGSKIDGSSAGNGDVGVAVFGGDVSVSGSLDVNTVKITTDGKIGIGTPSPSYKLEVGGNMSVGEFIYHRNNASGQNTYIQFADDAIGITAGGVQLVTIAEDAQDIVKIGDGTDVDFQVRTFADSNSLYVRGDNGRVGLGTNSPVSVLHVKESAPTISLQRENNSNSSTVEFLGQAGHTGATVSMMHLSSSNDLVFKTHDGSGQHEIMRLGGHFAEDVRQVILLSGSEMHFADMQPKLSTDLNFFVSGAIGNKQSIYNERGTSVFGGDLLVSGNIYADRIYDHTNENTFISFENNIIRMDVNNKRFFALDATSDTVFINPSQRNDISTAIMTDTTFGLVVDSGNDRIFLLSGSGDASSADEAKANDVSFHVSGSIGSKGTSSKGTAVFGGDTVVSGSLFAKQKQIYHTAGEVDGTDERFLGIMGNVTDASPLASFSKFKHQFIAPYPGRLKSIVARSAAGDGSNALNVKFYRSAGSDAKTGGTSVTTAVPLASANTSNGVDAAIEILQGDACAISIQRSGTNPGMTNITFVIEYDIFS